METDSEEAEGVRAQDRLHRGHGDVEEVVALRELVHAWRVAADAGVVHQHVKVVEVLEEPRCHSLGFSTQSYFTRVFKERTGMTPSEFRRRFYRLSEMGGV